MIKNTKGGLVGLLVVLITGIVILAYLGITYSDIEQSEAFQGVMVFIKHIWGTYIAPGFAYVWEHLVLNIIVPAFAKFFGGNEDSVEQIIETATSTSI